MLACARIGAIHSVVFAGFGAGALGERIRLSGSRLVVTADITYRRGQGGAAAARSSRRRWPAASTPWSRSSCCGATPDAAPAGATSTGTSSWPAARAATARPERMAANDPAFILATSGTTATPKLAVHVHGGYQVGIDTLASWIFGLGPDDVWWSTSDIGWIVGHSYIVYAPLLRGATTIAFEGAIDHPDPTSSTGCSRSTASPRVFTSPTAVRMLMRYGTEAAPRTTSRRVTRVFCAGEVLNPPAWEWLQKEAFAGPHAGHRPHVADRDRRPDVRQPLRPRPCCRSSPGSAGVPLPGWDVDVVAPDGEPRRRAARRAIFVRRPFPSLTPTLWNDPERYARDYWGRIEGVYFSGDAARLRRGRLRLVQRPRRRDHQDRRPPHRHGRGRVSAAAPPGRRRGRRDGPAGRAARRGHRGLRRAAAGPRAGRGARPRAARHGARGARRRRGDRRAATSSTRCPRRAAARSCAAC